MKKFRLIDLAALLVWILPIIYLIWVYPAMAQTVPLHFGLSGLPDRYGSKQEFLMFEFIFPAISLFAYLLLKFLPAVDPKKQVKYGEGAFQKLALAIVVLFAVINIAIISATASHLLQLDKVVFPAMGLFFVFLGNIMYSLKPNYFAGVRTPWTLESEDNWRATHRLAGKVWFAGGLLLTLISLLLTGNVEVIVYLCLVVVMALIPITYSYIYFRKHELK